MQVQAKSPLSASGCAGGAMSARAPVHLPVVTCASMPPATATRASQKPEVPQEDKPDSLLPFSWARNKSLLKREAIPMVTVAVPERPETVSPSAMPIIHSSAYLNQSFQDRISSSMATQSVDGEMSDRGSPGPLAMPSGTGTVMVRRKAPRIPASIPEEDLGRNALERALRKVDASLDEIEQNPSLTQRIVYDISRGPVGAATGTVVSAAAKLALEGAKRAAPVGKWALAEGAKLAGSLIKAAVVESFKAEGRKAAAASQNKGKGQGSTGTVRVSTKQTQKANRW